MSKDELLELFITRRGYKSCLTVEGDACSCRNAVRCVQRIDIGPREHTVVNVYPDSDGFFSGNTRSFDIVMVDGVHMCVQALSDIENSLASLRPGGVVLLHDCLPSDAWVGSQIPHGGAWCGDVYRAAAWYFAQSPYLCYTVDADCGIGVIDTSAPAGDVAHFPHRYMCDLSYDEFAASRDALLHVVSPESAVSLSGL